MGKAFDIGLERLTGGSEFSIGSSVTTKNKSTTKNGGGSTRAGASAGASELDAIRGAGRGTFFLETFGCQMNDHDSEKVAGVLLSRGYRQVASPDDAALILYNTCSIREKAAQKVFSRLGEYRTRQKDGQIM